MRLQYKERFTVLYHFFSVFSLAMNENDYDLLLDYWVEGVDESESSDIQRRIGMNSSLMSAYSRINNTFSPLKRLKEFERGSFGAPVGLANKTFQSIFLLDQQRKSGELAIPDNASGRRTPDNSSFSSRLRSGSPQRGLVDTVTTPTRSFLLQPLSLFACICAGFMLIMLPAAYYLQTGNSGANIVINSGSKKTELAGSSTRASSNEFSQAGFGLKVPAIDSKGLEAIVKGRANHSEFAATQYGAEYSRDVSVRPSQRLRTLQNQTPYSYVDNSANSSRVAQLGSFGPAPSNCQLVDLTGSASLAPSRVQLPEKVVCVHGSVALIPNSDKAVLIDPKAGAAPVLNEMLPSFEQTIPEQHDNFVCPQKCNHPNHNDSDPNWDPERAWDEGVPPVN